VNVECKSRTIHARAARLHDVDAIFRIINLYTEDNTLLPRSYSELCENVRDFVVVEAESRQIVGCGALHLYGMHLAEIRSIAVDPFAQGGGAGDRLVRALLAEAERHDVSCVCLFTRIPGFFARFDFQIAAKEDIPDKLYKDCQRCARRFACDETAMYRGELPRFAILAPNGALVPRLVELGA